jgi:hypothetical protein
MPASVGGRPAFARHLISVSKPVRGTLAGTDVFHPWCRWHRDERDIPLTSLESGRLDIYGMVRAER